jgi:hypothetical protein
VAATRLLFSSPQSRPAKEIIMNTSPNTNRPLAASVSRSSLRSQIYLSRRPIYQYSIPIHMRCGADLPAGCGFQDRPRRGAVRSDGWRLRNNRGAVAVFRRSIHPITVARTSLVGWGWACPATVHPSPVPHMPWSCELIQGDRVTDVTRAAVQAQAQACEVARFSG